MAHRRISSVGLTRLLASTSTPVYAVNQNRKILYVNPALSELTGVAPEKIVGQQCVYHDANSADPAAQLIADLCPPPESHTGVYSNTTMAFTKSDGTTSHYRVHFFPLHDRQQESLAIVAVCYAMEEEQATDTIAVLADPLHMLVRQFRRSQQHHFHIDRLIGDSLAMKKARSRIELAIDSTASVLLVGPPGSGRTHAAKAIHYNGPTAAASTFVPLDGALLGADLVRTTLTALDVRINSQRSDNCGTVLLSEVDQISGDVQTILADYLAKPKRNVRIIASAQRPLAKLVAEGSYREDLAAALTTITIVLPSLAQRVNDLPLMAQLFLEDGNSQSDKQISRFSNEALEMLCDYDWPGNLTQLEQVVREAHAAASGPMIETVDLPRQLHLAADASSRAEADDGEINLDEILTDVETQLIRRALKLSRGNKAAAARRLGISRPRLLRRIEQLGLRLEA